MRLRPLTCSCPTRQMLLPASLAASTPWFSISIWIWKGHCSRWASWPRTCLIELYCNNLHYISGSSSAVLMSETGEGQILPFFPSPLAGFTGAVWTLVWSLFGSGDTHTHTFIQTNVITASTASHIWDVLRHNEVLTGLIKKHVKSVCLVF